MPSRPKLNIAAQALVLALLTASFSGCAVLCLSPSSTHFIKQPEDISVLLGQPAAFMVSVFPPEAKLQWYKNNVVIPGATNNLFVLSSVTLADVGFYRCTASNSPPVDSNDAALSIYGPIDRRPSSVIVPVAQPYPGSAPSSLGPCGTFVGLVQFPRPGVSPQSFYWPPEAGSTSARLTDVTTGISGYSSSACLFQKSPARRNCSAGVSSVTAPVKTTTTYLPSVYVVGPSSLPRGTAISATMEWLR
ncbi:MAG TPA: immunoglobulin domain-containing protein [Verrucomicrobiota bacterium]|nr:immunoglobulin domain-containing protein [Verrucomicrobiota bacterium]